MRDQLLLGMKNRILRRTLRERLKLVPELNMHQVLKKAITMENDGQVEIPPVPASKILVREDGVQRHLKRLTDTLTLGMEQMAAQAEDRRRYPAQREALPREMAMTGQGCWSAAKRGIWPWTV